MNAICAGNQVGNSSNSGMERVACGGAWRHILPNCAVLQATLIDTNRLSIGWAILWNSSGSTSVMQRHLLTLIAWGLLRLSNEIHSLARIMEKTSESAWRISLGTMINWYAHQLRLEISPNDANTSAQVLEALKGGAGGTMTDSRRPISWVFYHPENAKKRLVASHNRPPLGLGALQPSLSPDYCLPAITRELAARRTCICSLSFRTRHLFVPSRPIVALQAGCNLKINGSASISITLLVDTGSV